MEATMNYNDKFIEFLSCLPHDGDPEFTKQISNYIVNIRPEEIDDLLTILKYHPDNQYKFGAFYSLMIYYRRMKIQSKSEHIVFEYGSQFRNKPLYLFQMSMIYRYRGEENDFKIALEYAKESIEAISRDENYESNYPGYYNNYAEIIAQALENEKYIDEKYIECAFSNINRAIMINPYYAKYYCTLGRLQSVTNDFANAKRNIIKSIDIEDVNKKDYPIRVAEYQDYLIKCNIRESLEKINETIKKNVGEISEIKNDLKNDMQNEKNSILEFIGFFTAIITFIISSVQISISLEYQSAISFILVMLGALIVAFGTLRTIIKMDKQAVKVTILFAFIGIIFICGGIFLNSIW